MIGDPAAEEHSERRPDRNAQREERKGSGAPLLGEEVGDERIGRRHAARLADSDAHPGQEQLPEILGVAAQGREEAPERDRDRDDVDPAPPVGEPGDRNRKARIEEGEGDPAHQAELAVGQRQLRLDRHRQHADDLAVDEIEDVGDEQDGQHSAAGRLPDCRCRTDPAPRLAHVRTSIRSSGRPGADFRRKP
jgi:hypothetical protein